MQHTPSDDMQAQQPISAMGILFFVNTGVLLLGMILIPVLSMVAFAPVFTFLHEVAHYLAITAFGHHADLELGRWFSWSLTNQTNIALVPGQPTPFWLFLGAPYFLWMAVSLTVLVLVTWWPKRFLDRLIVAVPLMILISGAATDTVGNIMAFSPTCDPMRVANIYSLPGTIGVMVVMVVTVASLGVAYAAFLRRYVPTITARLRAQPPARFLSANRERAIRIAFLLVFVIAMLSLARDFIRQGLAPTFGLDATIQAFVTVVIAAVVLGFLWLLKTASNVLIFGEFPSSNLGRACSASAPGIPQDMLPIHAERVAVHEAGHALVLAALDRVWPNTTVSIVPNQGSLGRILWRPNGTVTPEALTWALYMHLGGMAAGTALKLETTGAGDDIRQWEDSVRPSLLQRCTGFFAQPASPAEAEHNATALAKLRREHLDVLDGFFAANTTVLRELADLLITRKAIGLDELRPFLDRVDTAPLGLGKINLDHLILYQTTADPSSGAVHCSSAALSMTSISSH